ncbi:regulation of CoA-transferase [Desmophyllum pertusum]|uniref:Regulation of CoA-transferase n=1 Tax=Desmophyllum pertusum TaxID=174260 RepID=A0A9X0D642_9CNID|nr:regulation of CoA-transferase [Desmophyllum pertusum]
MVQAGRIVSLMAFICCVTEAAVETNETRLYKELFENYNKYNHPVTNESKPVKVVFDFQLIRIIDVVSPHYFTS